jgi:predicted ester cyclase
MAAQDNKAVGERLMDAWNRSDFAEVEQIVSPDFVNYNPPPIPGAGADRDGLLTAMRYLRQALPDGRGEIVNLLAEGDKIVVHDIIRGTHEGDFMGVSPTGRRVSFEFIHIFRLADGRIVERWGLADAMGLMQQMGAIPTPQTVEA